MNVGVIGSRTYPLTAAHFAELAPAQQTEARKLGKRYVTEQLQRLLRPDDRVVSGAAKGPDTWGVEAAKAMGLEVLEFPADWSKGRGAGFARNTTIMEQSDVIIAFWDRVSRGTLDTVAKAHAVGKPVLVIFGDPRYRHCNPEWTQMELARGGCFTEYAEAK